MIEGLYVALIVLAVSTGIGGFVALISALEAQNFESRATRVAGAVILAVLTALLAGGAAAIG